MPLKKVLIADDDRVLVAGLSAALRDKRVGLIIAADAMQAFMYALRERPDAIVLDIGMPGGTGIHALTKLRGNRKTALIPVLVLTGLNDADLPAKIRDLGAAFARKPLAPAQLYPMLEELVTRRTAILNTVESVVHGNTVDDIVHRLAGQGLEATEADVAVVLQHLHAEHRLVAKDDRWYIA